MVVESVTSQCRGGGTDISRLMVLSGGRLYQAQLVTASDVGSAGATRDTRDGRRGGLQ